MKYFVASSETFDSLLEIEAIHEFVTLARNWSKNQLLANRKKELPRNNQQSAPSLDIIVKSNEFKCRSSVNNNLKRAVRGSLKSDLMLLENAADKMCKDDI